MPATELASSSSDRRPIASRSLRISQQLAAALARLGLSANAISTLGLVAAILAGLGLACTNSHVDFAHSKPAVERLLFLAAALLIPLRLLCNMLDGLVAVEYGKGGPTGALFNEVPDRLADTAVLIGAGYAATSSPTLGYLAALGALFVTYIRVLGRSLGHPSDFRGPMAKQQRMILTIAASLFLAAAPAGWRVEFRLGDTAFGIMSVTLAIVILGCIFTAFRRLATLARRMKNVPPVPGSSKSAT